MDIQTRPDPVARARELGPEIAAAADEIERTRRIPDALLGRLHDSRLFRMLLPRSASGDETEPAVYVAAIEELARHDGSIAWNAFVANSSSLLAAYLEPAVNHAIFADPRSIVAWGPPNASRAIAVEASAIASPASGISPAAAGRPVGWARTAMWSKRTARFGSTALAGPPNARSCFRRARRPSSTPGKRSGCAARRRTPIASTTCSCPSVQCHPRGSDAAPRARPPLCLYHAVPLRDGVAAVALGIARAMLSEFVMLASRKSPRGLARLAENAVVQADVARAEARLGSARAYLIETLVTLYAHADDTAPIEVSDRARVRLACTNAIQGAIEVADFAYKGAGVDAIFPGSPFERRFRDMHTLSQQIQARSAHFESVGQILLGVPPEVFL